MSQKFRLKRSSVEAKVPDAGDLGIGELAVNLADRKLYTKDTWDEVIELGKQPTQLSELENDSGFITDAGVTKIVAGTDITLAPADGTGEVTINATGGFSGNYDDLANKPDIPSATSDLTNDSGFITGVNLGYSPNGNSAATITNDSGDDATIPLATHNQAGLMTGGEKQKLAGIQDGAQANPDLSGYVQAGDNISELTNDSGFITDAGVTKIVAGDNITVSGDGTGEVTITGTGGSGGTNQNLSYADGGKDGAGTVQITDGTNATIPTVSSSKAGLMTGSQKQLLDGIVNDGGGFSGNYNDLSNKPSIPSKTSQLQNDSGFITAAQVPKGVTKAEKPMEIISGNTVKLAYDRGLTNWLDRLEVDAGRGLGFNGSKLQVSTPAKDVANFQAINIQNNATSTYPCTRGELGHSGVWQGNFTIPDGAVGFVAIMRCRSNLVGTIDKNVSDSAIYQTIWAESAGFKMTFSNNISGNGSAGGFITHLAMVPKNNRGVGGHAVKTHVVNCSGSGDRTVNYRADSYTSDSNGASPPICEMRHDAFNMTIIPFGTTY